MNRDKSIKIRVTEDELSAIRARCTKPQLAEWLRELALDQKTVKPTPVADPQLLRQIAAIGSNLNQLARWINSTKPKQATALIEQLISIDRALQGLIDDHKNP